MISHLLLDFRACFWYSLNTLGEVEERLNSQHWKCCVSQGTGGSNPSLSANRSASKGCRAEAQRRRADNIIIL